MTQPQDSQRAAHDAAAYAVLLSRFESHAAAFSEFRSEFQRFAERNGERVSALELNQQHLSTIVELVRDELKVLKEERRSDEKVRKDEKEAADDDRRRLSERVGNLETAMTDIQELKRMVIGQIVGLVITVVIFGSLFAYVLLRP